MQQKLLGVMFFGLALSLAARAATLSGKVTGVAGSSIVYIEAITGKSFPAPAQHPVMAQRHLMFEPHVLAVQQGSTVDFLNSDGTSHNVFWVSIGGNKKLGHNMGSWAQNEKRGFKFDNTGTVPLLCNAHPQMKGFIVVVPTPYFALTSESGEYKIENIAAGSYSLTAWHEGSKNQTVHVDVAGDTTADVALSR